MHILIYRQLFDNQWMLPKWRSNIIKVTVLHFHNIGSALEKCRIPMKVLLVSYFQSIAYTWPQCWFHNVYVLDPYCRSDGVAFQKCRFRISKCWFHIAEVFVLQVQNGKVQLQSFSYMHGAISLTSHFLLEFCRQISADKGECKPKCAENFLPRQMKLLASLSHFLA